MGQVKILDANFGANVAIFEDKINGFLADGWEVLDIQLAMGGTRWIAVLLREDEDDDARVPGQPVAPVKPTRKSSAKASKDEPVALPEPPASPDLGIVELGETKIVAG